MNDLWLFLGCIVFLFVLWVYSGGPNNPISFAGPYITPVTAPGVTQVGYGNSANSWGTSSSNASPNQTFWNRWTSGDPSARITFGNPSSYAGTVHLQRGALGTGNVNTEYLIIRSGSNAQVTITGWQLVGLSSNSHVVITQGTTVVNPYGQNTVGPITLAPGGEAIITTGSSPFGVSFLENACSGYLSSSASFNPPLGMNCPYPLNDLRTYYSGGQQWEFNECAQFVSGIYNCRVPNTDTARLPSSCQQFIDTDLNYSGCLANHHADAGFLGTIWHVYLGQPKTLWQSGETIDLLDASGKVVDESTY